MRITTRRDRPATVGHYPTEMPPIQAMTSPATRLARRLGAALLVVAVAPSTGCFLFGTGGDDGPDGVEMGGGFELDPSCELDGELSLAIGDGAEGFTALGDGQSPQVFHGPQGGSHMWLGVRIGNVALERYDVVRVASEMFDPAQCLEVGQPCEGPGQWHSGEWVLGDVTELEPIDAHTLEQDRLTAIFDIHGQALVLQVTVEDPCGQVGFAEHRFVAG